jgi:hypothetical protein
MRHNRKNGNTSKETIRPSAGRRSPLLLRQGVKAGIGAAQTSPEVGSPDTEADLRPNMKHTDVEASRSTATAQQEADGPSNTAELDSGGATPTPDHANSDAAVRTIAEPAGYDGVRDPALPDETQTQQAARAGDRMPFHPLADIFPVLGEESLWELAQDIREHGLLDPVVLHDGKILDGRCRYMACKMVRVECRYENFVGGDLLGYIVSRNLHRRHLTGSQRAMAAARIADMKVGANQHSVGMPIGGASDLLNVGQRSVSRARTVLHQGSSELVQAVERGDITVSAAAEISHMPAQQQRDFVGPEGEGKAAAKKRRAKGQGVSRGKPTARAESGDKAKATAAVVNKLQAALAEMAEALRKAQEELAAARLATPAVAVTSPPTVPEMDGLELTATAMTEIERLKAEIAGKDEALRSANKEPMRGEMPPIPGFLHRRPLSTAEQAVLDDLIGIVNREIKPKLTSAPAIDRERLVDEIVQFVRGL